MNRDTRRITDGAMMAAIIGVLLLINRQLAGLIEVTFIWALPLPMVFYSAKYGYKNGFVLLIAVTLLTIVIGTPQTLFYVISEMLIGIVYGGGIHDKVAGRKIVIRTIMMAVVADIISMLVFATFFGYDIASEIKEYENIINQTSAQMNISLGDIDLEQLLKNVVVVSVVVSGVLEGYITHILSRLMLKRLRIYVVPMKPISEYFPPKWSGYLGIVAVMCYYYSIYRGSSNEILQSIMQGFGIAGIVYLAVMGMVCVMIFLKIQTKMKSGCGIIAFILMFIATIFVAMLGFLYITTDIHSELMEGGNKNAFKNS